VSVFVESRAHPHGTRRTDVVVPDCVSSSGSACVVRLPGWRSPATAVGHRISLLGPRTTAVNA